MLASVLRRSEAAPCQLTQSTSKLKRSIALDSTFDASDRRRPSSQVTQASTKRSTVRGYAPLQVWDRSGLAAKCRLWPSRGMREQMWLLQNTWASICRGLLCRPRRVYAGVLAACAAKLNERISWISSYFKFNASITFYSSTLSAAAICWIGQAQVCDPGATLRKQICATLTESIGNGQQCLFFSACLVTILTFIIGVFRFI